MMRKYEEVLYEKIFFLFATYQYISQSAVSRAIGVELTLKIHFRLFLSSTRATPSSRLSPLLVRSWLIASCKQHLSLPRGLFQLISSGLNLRHWRVRQSDGQHSRCLYHPRWFFSTRRLAWSWYVLALTPSLMMCSCHEILSMVHRHCMLKLAICFAMDFITDYISEV